MSDTIENEYKIFSDNYSLEFAIVDKNFIFAFAPNVVVSDYIKSKEFVSLDEFFEQNFIKIMLDKKKYIYLRDGKTKYNLDLIEKIVNFLVKVMGYNRDSIYVHVEFEKPLCLKVDENFYVFVAPILE